MTKPTKWLCTQWRLRSVWPESLLCTQWVAKDPTFLHAVSEDTDQNGQMPRLIWAFTGCTCHFVGFAMRWLICQVFIFDSTMILLVFSDKSLNYSNGKEGIRVYLRSVRVDISFKLPSNYLLIAKRLCLCCDLSLLLFKILNKWKLPMLTGTLTARC